MPTAVNMRVGSLFVFNILLLRYRYLGRHGRQVLTANLGGSRYGHAD